MAITKIVIILCAIALSEAAVKVTRSSQDGRHPSSMEIEVNLPNSQEKAKLKLKKIVSKQSVPVSVLDNGVTTSIPSELLADESGHYEDLENGALISTRFVNGKQQFDGHFSHKREAYFMDSPNSKSSEHKIRRGPKSLAKHFARGKRETDTTYTVEVHLLLDHTVWRFFRSQESSDAEAFKLMSYYYQHIMYSVDQVYRNIGSCLSISVEVVRLTYAMTSNDSVWMKDKNALNILDNLVKFVDEQNVTADHLMAFTVSDIHDETNNNEVLGMAFMGRVCTPGKVSISEDQGLHSWYVAAHELGHNLGSDHDGSGNNTCNSTLSYVMASSSNTPNTDNIENTYRLSSCSISSITEHVQSLSPNCLTSNDMLSTRFSQTIKAGKRWSLDQVCKFSYPGSIFFANYEAPAHICVEIKCRYQNAIKHSTGMRAPEGTPCGSKKSCNNKGRCVEDNTAPEADETCFFGNRYTDDECADIINRVENNSDFAKQYCKTIKIICCKTLGNQCDSYL